MEKVEKYIRDYTRTCSNEMDFKENGEPAYHPWLTPDHARAVAQIAREEVIDKACEWLESVNLDFYQIREGVFSRQLVEDFKKYLEEGK